MSDWTTDNPVERSEGLRDDPIWVAAQWARPGTQVIAVDRDGRLSATVDGLDWQPAVGDFDDQRHYLLGTRSSGAVFVTLVDQAANSLRAVLDQLSAEELQISFGAVGLAGWHARAGFCPNCGSATKVVSGGSARRCPGCGLEDYPRTDPAVIVAVVDTDGRLLLGRQPSWPARRYSVLAGFAETGESLEQTVRREIGEEVGVSLGEIGYLGSQPWPFPRSMMVAFAATALTTELHPAPGEIEEAIWFSVAELQVALESGAVELPTSASIARRMIEAWLAGRLTVESFR
jgi:NAD+ diphosphatase